MILLNHTRLLKIEKELMAVLLDSFIFVYSYCHIFILFGVILGMSISFPGYFYAFREV